MKQSHANSIQWNDARIQQTTQRYMKPKPVEYSAGDDTLYRVEGWKCGRERQPAQQQWMERGRDVQRVVELPWLVMLLLLSLRLLSVNWSLKWPLTALTSITRCDGSGCTAYDGCGLDSWYMYGAAAVECGADCACGSGGGPGANTVAAWAANGDCCISGDGSGMYMEAVTGVEWDMCS